jgi:hypothetical protein
MMEYKRIKIPKEVVIINSLGLGEHPPTTDKTRTKKGQGNYERNSHCRIVTSSDLPHYLGLY